LHRAFDSLNRKYCIFLTKDGEPFANGYGRIAFDFFPNWLQDPLYNFTVVSHYLHASRLEQYDWLRALVSSRYNISIVEGENHLIIERPKAPSHNRSRNFKPPKVRMAMQTVRHYKRIREKSAQKLLQNTHLDVFQPISPSRKEFSDDLIDGPEVWGRKKLTAWKEGCGRGKEWRYCRCGKANKKHLAKNQSIRRNWSIRTSWKTSPSAVPINVFRRDTSFKFTRWARPHKNCGRGDAAILQHPIQDLLWRDVTTSLG